MKIAFFTNHFKTEFFHALSPMLEDMGHEIYWISTSRTWSQWLLARGLPMTHLLDLTRHGPEWASKKILTDDDEEQLRFLEKYGRFRINNLIMMDRLLSGKAHNYARACLAVSAREIRRFLNNNKIVAFFSEATWAMELVAIQICGEIGCCHYAPHTVRIPGDRFGFFQGHTQSSLLDVREPNDDDRAAAAEFYDFYLQKSPRPPYWHADYRSPQFRMNWLKKFRANLRRYHDDPYDEMQPSPWRLVRSRWKEVSITRRLAMTRTFAKVQLPPERPFILHTLHVQPEASIDVLGSYMSNQLELIRALARSTPATHDLYVKEHQIALGSRPLDFYHNIRRLPGVRLIDPYADSHALIKQADLVVTLTGTIAYEAALYGVPAMTVMPMYFGPVLARNGFNPFDESAASLFDRLDADKPDPEQIRQRNLDFLAQVFARSFAGTISDPRHGPECMTPDNLDRVAEAFDLVLNRQEVRQPGQVP